MARSMYLSQFKHRLCAPLIAAFSLMLFALGELTAQEVRTVEIVQGKQIELISKNGNSILLDANGDEDDDEISNSLEIFGFTYSILDGLQPWSGDSSVVYYKTDPLRWSTDGDPYSDLMEVTGANMPAGVPSPYNHPLVAARPVIVVAMEDFEVHPTGTISNSNGGSQSTSYTNETSFSVEEGGEINTELSLSPAGLGGGIGTSFSYSETRTTTNSTTSTFGSNWNRTWSTNPAAAANLTLRIFLQNMGSATALDVIPTFNLILGDKTIATITLAEEDAAEVLTARGLPSSRYPILGSIAIEKDHQGNDITVTMDELRAIQMGAPLSLAVIQVSANVARWNPATEGFDAEIRWSSFEAEIDPVVTTIKANLGDDDIRYYQVYVKTEYYTLDFRFRDVLKHVFNLQEGVANTTIEGRNYPAEWYVSTASDSLINKWDALGRPDNLMNLPMYPNTLLAMMSPGTDPAPKINLAIYSHDFKKVYVSAFPNNFPIISAKANVTINNQAQEIDLVRADSALFTNAIPFDNFAEPNGTIRVENARGDVAVATIAFPAGYSSAADVKLLSGLIPNPGGNFLLFHHGNSERPFEAYCLFFDLQTGQELATPREYISLPESGNSSNFVDLSKSGNARKRLWWNKLRINPRTLKVARNDTTFHDFEVVRGNWSSNDVDVKYGSVTLNSVELFDTVHANINLNGTPFALAAYPEYSPLWNATSMRIEVDAMRKSADVLFWPYADYVTDLFGFEGDSLALVYQTEVMSAADEVQLDEKTVQLNRSGNGGGYVNMGDANTLRVSNSITVEAWAKAEAHVQGYNDYATLLNKEGEFQIARFPDGTIRFSLAKNEGNWYWYNTDAVTDVGEWFHVALAYDKNSVDAAVKFYINGNETFFTADDHSTNVGDAHPQLNDFRIGSRQDDPAAQFAGQIDEVRLWNIERSMEEIRASLIDTLGPEVYTSNTSGLIGYWRFDELEDLGVGLPGANDVRDLSVNGNHGDLVGDALLGGGITGIIGTSEDRVPGRIVLAQNFPNPFNPETTIRFQLKNSTDVRLEVFNTLGQKVATLVDSKHNAGEHTIVWDATNSAGRKVASGLYLYRLTAEGFVQTRKMVVLK
ncbi:MAG: LamG-like jellyroll fold domain-containing protein [Calditrichia bacterium]